MGCVHVRPRQKGRKQKVKLTLQEIAARTHMPLQGAADSFGVSTTTLKQACRRLGIARWPYRRRRSCAVEAEAEDATPCGDEADLSWLIAPRAQAASDLWFLGIDYSDVDDVWSVRDDQRHGVMGKK